MEVYRITTIPNEYFNTRTISIIKDNKVLVLSHDRDSNERLNIYYFDKNTAPTSPYWVGSHSNRSYNLFVGDVPPKKYAAEVEFLREQFDKIDWDAYEVMTSITGQFSHELA